MKHKLEMELKPKYANSIFTWHQIETALSKILSNNMKVMRLWVYLVVIFILFVLIAWILWVWFGYSYWWMLGVLIVGTVMNFTMMILSERAFWKNF